MFSFKIILMRQHSVPVTYFARVLMEKLCFCNSYIFYFGIFPKKFFILLVVNNYLCIWSSLFQYVLNPTFRNEHIASLDSSSKLSRAYDGTTYLPGMSLISILNAQQFKNKFMWKETKSVVEPDYLSDFRNCGSEQYQGEWLLQCDTTGL